MSILKVEELAVHYGAVRALDGVDLQIRTGEIHGVIGPNGAGKSTFIDAVSGRVSPTQGRVLLRGEDVTRRSVTWRRRHGIGRSFQRTSVFPGLTVGTQLELVGRHLDEPDLSDIVDRLSLAPLMDQLCGQISYGDQRRVDLALALLGEPDLLLLDEPAAGLTASETQKLIEHIGLLADQRKLTVLLVEHDVEAVFACSENVTVLDRGRVLMTGDPESVRSDPAVVRAYLGSES